MDTVSRFPVPELDSLPADIRARIVAVHEKAGFIPNVFLAWAHRPDEFRAFFAYHDALLEKEGGLTKAEREMIVVATSAVNLTPRQRAMLDFGVKVAARSHEVDEADFAALRAHGMGDDEIWDIGAIAALFALSNRMANLMALRPNDEFYLMGRAPAKK